MSIRLIPLTDPDRRPSSRRIAWLAAEDDGTPVGSAFLRLDSRPSYSHVGEFELTVHPDLRADVTVGRRLLATAIDVVAHDGGGPVQWWAFEATTVDYLKAEYLVQQARVLKLAGKQQEAIAAYRQVLSDFAETPVATEATVRLAELTQGQLGV